jgi:tRNA(adenine34) deaminase
MRAESRLNNTLRKRDFLKLALAQAKNAGKRNEVPIGALIVKDGKIIARAFNQTEKCQNFLAHAELLCIQKACQKLKTKYLNGCELYITLEPCRMCESAARLCRIDKIFYLTPSLKFGAKGPAYHKIAVKHRPLDLHDENAALLSAFFQKRRKLK